MNKITDTTNIGITFQMTLDTFLDELHPIKNVDKQNYEYALKTLEEMKQFRNPKTKCDIAQKALEYCPTCIEAYLALGRYHQDVYERMQIYKDGMELATMDLGKDFFLQNIQDFFALDQAKPLFHIKFAYACTLYELGYMRKSQQQFQEILHLNPTDHFMVHHYLFALYIYFEELSKCKELLNRYNDNDTFYTYICFLLMIKQGEYKRAKDMIHELRQQNRNLFDMMTYKTMNISHLQKLYDAGSIEEAGYIYRILSKAIHAQDCLHIFMNND